MAANGPLMYHVQSLHNYNSDIKLPTCMYKMQNIHQDEPELNTSKQEDSKNLDLIELEKSQLGIIQKLEDLKATVIQLKQELGIVADKSFGAFQDIVIKANPHYPPLSVWVFYNLLSSSTSTRLVTYRHSSLKDVPADVCLPRGISSSDSCNLSLTVIWREGEGDHEMMISPMHQSAIEGEVNIARYLSRLIPSIYDAEDIAVSTQIDNWLEMAHSSVIHGNNKDRQGFLRSLNSHLGKATYLVGEDYTVADIVMWSALTQTKLYLNLPANALKWFKSLSEIDVFKKFLSLEFLL